MPITKINDEGREFGDECTNRRCLNSGTRSDIRTVLKAGMMMAAIALVETTGDQTFLCFTHLFRLLNEQWNESKRYQLRRSTIKTNGSAIPARIDAVLNSLLNGVISDSVNIKTSGTG